MTQPSLATTAKQTKEACLRQEVLRMLANPNPLTGIYSIYGDYPIDPPHDQQAREKKLERMRATR